MANGDWFEHRNEGDVAIVSFIKDEILDTILIKRMGADLDELLDAEPRTKFLLDFANVAYLSSEALRMLLGVQKTLAATDGQLKLAGISDRIMEAFRITKLDEVFDIYDTAQAALEAFRRSG